MAEIELKYGRTAFSLQYDERRFEVLKAPDHRDPLIDAQIGEKLDSPIGSSSIEAMVNPGDTVLIVVPDVTRQVGCGQVVNLVVRRLIASGVNAFDIRVIFATGIHRKVTEAEKAEILTPFIAQRIKTLDHDPRDLAQIIRLGETSGGIPIELNKALVEHDHVIIIGGITFHYFAGFTGGRKSICPGLASSRTISETHKLAFDCETRKRREGVGTALLDGNAVHEAFIEAASVVKAGFAISTMVNDAGEIVDLYTGDWITSHRVACDVYSASNTINIEEKRDLVIASCGGYPSDVNLIQAHKTLETASLACSDGGTILLLAECDDGLGRTDFLKWFEAETSNDLASILCEKYQVNGQTAWSLLRKTERFDIRVLTSLDDEALRRMRSKRIDVDEISRELNGSRAGYILPSGSHIHIKTN